MASPRVDALAQLGDRVGPGGHQILHPGQRRRHLGQAVQVIQHAQHQLGWQRQRAEHRSAVYEPAPGA